MLSIFILANVSSCSLWNRISNSDSDKNPKNNSKASANIPFSTKEPESFQAEIIVNTFINGEKNEQKYFIARKNGNSLQKFYAGSQNERSILRTAENKTFLINYQAKNYREIDSAKAPTFSEEKFIKNLTSKWLNEKASTTFEKFGAENNLTKYLVKFEDAKKSEVFIFVDEKLKLPVKQEFYSITENKKTLTFLLEMKNFKTEVDENLFELPKDFEAVK